MSLWPRRRDLRTHLFIATVIKFFSCICVHFSYIFLLFLLDFIIVTINLIQLLAAILAHQKRMWPVALFVRFMNRAYSNGNLYRHWPAYAFITFNIRAMADS